MMSSFQVAMRSGRVHLRLNGVSCQTLSLGPRLAVGMTIFAGFAPLYATSLASFYINIGGMHGVCTAGAAAACAHCDRGDISRGMYIVKRHNIGSESPYFPTAQVCSIHVSILSSKALTCHIVDAFPVANYS